MRARARERERERERERKRSEVELSLSLFCFSDRFCGALFSSPKRHTTLPSPPNRRIGEASIIGKRDVLLKEKREKTMRFCAHIIGVLSSSRERSASIFSLPSYSTALCLLQFLFVVPFPPRAPFVRARARFCAYYFFNKRTKK